MEKRERDDAGYLRRIKSRSLPLWRHETGLKGMEKEETQKKLPSEAKTEDQINMPSEKSETTESSSFEGKKSFFSKCRERLTDWKRLLFDAVNERSAEIKHAKLKRILVAVGICVFIVGFITFYVVVGKKIAFFIKDREGFRNWLTGFGKGSVIVFICLRVVQTVTKLIPGEALEIAAGCMFGAWEGLLWCLVGSVIGSFIIIFLGRRYGTKLVGLFVSPKKMQSAAFLKNKKRLNFTFFLLYFIPGTPKDIFTWLVSLTDENAFWFVFITTIARIPSVITSTWCGQALVNENYLLSAGIFGATVLCGIIGGLIYKLAGGRKKVPPENDEEEK